MKLTRNLSLIIRRRLIIGENEEKIPVGYKSFIRWIEQNYPTILDKLKVTRHFQDDDYGHPYLTRLIYRDKDGDFWVEEFTQASNGARFEISSKLEKMYKVFGEEMIEYFFLKIHKIDIKNSEGFKYNWLFEDM